MVTNKRGQIAIWLIAGLALLFSLFQALDPAREDSSQLWFLDLLLVGGFVIGLWLNRRGGLRARVNLSPRQAAVVFAMSAWLTGMLYELSLRTGERGFGGMHEDTATSFLLAQGWYIPFALGGLWLVRRYRYRFDELYFAAGAAALVEVLMTGSFMLLLSPMFYLGMVLLAYFFQIYAMFLTWPLLFVDERILWRADGPTISPWRKVLYGGLLGIACWGTFVLWSALVLRVI